MLTGKKILLCITGSIAAYKTPLLVRQLVKAGAEVKVLMTPAAEDFVSKLSLSTVSKNPVLTGLFDEGSWVNHVILGRWADAMLIAPLSCNTLSKMANGLCDNLVLATYLSSTCPVLVAPAMDEDMWHHAATQRNIQIIEESGCTVLPVAYGELASGLTGDGRMMEPEEILGYLEEYFTRLQQLKGKKVLVTAGPTYEAIDPVRFIGNHSSGKMGYALVEELSKRGAEVTLVSGPVTLNKKLKGVNLINVTSAEEMYTACLQTNGYHIAIMSAAVADYSPAEISKEKIKKSGDEFTITLKKTKDILKEFGKNKTNGQILVGFALETENEKENALKKLKEKNADIIVLNSLKDEGAGFRHNTNDVTIYYKDGKTKETGLKSKTEIAKDIIDSITELL